MFAKKKRLAPLPLLPVFVEEPFRQWGLDFIGEINPPSSGKFKWILTATDYFIKWVEAIPTRKANDLVVMKFLEENIFSRFGCPVNIVTYNAQVFNSIRFINFCQTYNVILSHSKTYHPQGNGLEKSSNKTLVNILKKTINENQKNWDSKLVFALWATRMTTRRSTGKSPYELVYGTQAFFPTHMVKPVIYFLQYAQEEPNAMIRRMNNVMELSESRNKFRENLLTYQRKMKTIFDRKAKEIMFQKGDLVLRWDTRKEDKGKHNKFDPLWYGPLKINEVKKNNTFMLENIEGEVLYMPVNGKYLKHYFQH